MPNAEVIEQGRSQTEDKPKVAAIDSRQAALVPPEKIKLVHAVVVGAGAVGRQLALQLSVMGVPRMTLYDGDRVEEVNFRPQMYPPQALGQNKAVVTGADAEYLSGGGCQVDVRPFMWQQKDAQIALERHAENKKAGETLCVFACVDRPDVRGHIFNAFQGKADMFSDSRVGAEVIRQLFVDWRIEQGEWYEKTLFDAAEAFSEGCTSRMTVYLAAIAAGHHAKGLARWLRGGHVEPDLTMSLLSDEIERGCYE